MRRLLLILGPAIVLAACGGGDSSTGAAADQDRSEEVARAEPDTEPALTADADYDPDSADLRNLLFWQSLSGEGFLTAPEVLLRELDTLATSEHPGADKYLVDLANVPTPYALRIIDHLRERFDRPDARSLSDFPELAVLPEGDGESVAYLEFKQQLFGSIDPTLAIFLSERHARTLDSREVRYGGVGVDVIPPLEFPAYVSAAEAAAWLNPDDDVLGVSIDGDVRAFPIRIIGWHEMLNDTIGGVPV